MFNFDSFKSAFSVGTIIGGALKEQLSVGCEKAANVCYDAGDCLMNKAVTLHEEANKRRKEADLEEYTRTITPRNTVVEKEVVKEVPVEKVVEKEVIKEVIKPDPEMEKKLAIVKQNYGTFQVEAQKREEALKKEVETQKRTAATWQSKCSKLENENNELRKEVKEQGIKINTLEDRMNMILQKLEETASAPAPEPKKSPKNGTKKQASKRARISTGVYDTVEEAKAAEFEKTHAVDADEMDDLDALLNNAVETDSI